MEELETPHPDYIKGFNEGYAIASHLPELAEQLSKAATQSQRSEGFKSGREQVLSEMKENRYPSFLRKDRLSDVNKEATKEIDKDER